MMKRSRPMQLVGRLTSFVCSCSIVEIYNEVVSDLLDPTRTNLLVHDSGRGVVIDNLSRVQVQSGDGAAHCPAARKLYNGCSLVAAPPHSAQTQVLHASACFCPNVKFEADILKA